MTCLFFGRRPFLQNGTTYGVALVQGARHPIEINEQSDGVRTVVTQPQRREQELLGRAACPAVDRNVRDRQGAVLPWGAGDNLPYFLQALLLIGYRAGYELLPL